MCATALSAAGCSSGGQAQNEPLPQAKATLRLSTPAFTDGGTIPRRFTCDGGGPPPTISVANVPPTARELALFVDDPDAPGGDFSHWTVYGIPARNGRLLVNEGREGRNSLGRVGWADPCPPDGDQPHHYVFVLYALSKPSGLREGASVDEAIAAVKSAVLARGTLTGRYGRR